MWYDNDKDLLLGHTPHMVTYVIIIIYQQVWFTAVPEFREGVDNDTKDDVQTNSCDEYEEWQIINHKEAKSEECVLSLMVCNVLKLKSRLRLIRYKKQDISFKNWPSSLKSLPKVGLGLLWMKLFASFILKIKLLQTLYYINKEIYTLFFIPQRVQLWDRILSWWLCIAIM